MKSQTHTTSDAVAGLKTILIRMPIYRYDNFLKKCESWRGEFNILKNGVITRDGSEQRQVEIRCNALHAELLSDLAKSVYPEAALDIEESIRLSREP